MAPPSHAASALPEFYFFLCLRSLRVPVPRGQLPKDLLLVFTLPSPVSFNWVLTQPLPLCCTGQAQSRMCLAALGRAAAAPSASFSLGQQCSMGWH